MCASSELVSMGPMGWVRGPGCSQRYGADRGAVVVLEGSTNLHELVNLDRVVCVLS